MSHVKALKDEFHFPATPARTTGFWRYIALTVTLFLASPAFASLKDIHIEKLPQDPTILKAYSDVSSVEDMVKIFHDPWKFETPKTKVAALLKTSLDKLAKANNSAPGNEELGLLIGLVATYAYNIDVGGSHDLATNVLAKAQKLAPDDYRPEWLLGNLQCQTLELRQGMTRLLTIENSSKWDQLSAGFWDDYIYCAYVTNMPAHVLRAAAYLKKLNAVPSKDRDLVIEVARKRFISLDPTKNYSSTQIWFDEEADSSSSFTNTMFGVRASIASTWKSNFGDVLDGISTVQLQTGPHPGKNGGVTPNILLFMRAPREGETLTDYVKSLMPGSSPKPIAVSVCPVEECLAFGDDKPSLYKDEGGGHAIVIVFQRKSPEFPGMLFEKPVGPPAPGKGNATYSRPVDRIRRLEGTLYYLVLLDFADSVTKDAKADYEIFLKNMVVE